MWCASSAAMQAKGAAWVSLPPKPPPMRRTSTVTAWCGLAENRGDQVLHLARVLGRAPDQQVAVLARHGKRDLALQIEVVLAAHPDAAREPMRRVGDRLLGLAAAHLVRRQDRGFLGERVLDRSGSARARGSRPRPGARRGAPARPWSRRPRTAPGRRIRPRPRRTADRRGTPARRRCCPAHPPR